MATFTDEKIREALKEALEHDPEDEMDLLEALIKELGLASWSETEMVFLLEKIRSIPEADILIRAKHAGEGAEVIRRGRERLAQAVNNGS